MSYVLVSSLAALAAAGYGFARFHSQARLPLEPGELLARSRRMLDEAFADFADLEPRWTAGTAGNAALRREARQARDALQELRGALDIVASRDEALLVDPELRRLLVDLHAAIESGAATIHRIGRQVRSAGGPS
jgi:hypothetical protein